MIDIFLLCDIKIFKFFIIVVNGVCMLCEIDFKKFECVSWCLVCNMDFFVCLSNVIFLMVRESLFNIDFNIDVLYGLIIWEFW